MSTTYTMRNVSNHPDRIQRLGQRQILFPDWEKRFEVIKKNCQVWWAAVYQFMKDKAQ